MMFLSINVIITIIIKSLKECLFLQEFWLDDIKTTDGKNSSCKNNNILFYKQTYYFTATNSSHKRVSNVVFY